MEIKQMVLKELDLATINTAYYNPRKDLKPSDKAYEQLKNSILTYGYIDPLIYNERTERLVGGHQRLKILKDLGVKKAQVSVVDLPEDLEKALNVTLNKVQGEFENDSLAKLLQELAEEDFNLEDLGFDQQEFDDLVYELEMEEQRSGSFLNDIIQEETEENTNDIQDNTGINREATAFDIQNVHVNVHEHEYQNEHKEEQELYPSYTKPTVEADTREYDKEDAEQYFKMTFPVTFEERDLLLDAIKRAKNEFGCTTSSEAILRICNFYLGGKP